MGVTPKHLEDESDFFARELEKMSIFENNNDDHDEWNEGWS